jgi:glycerophosphoryl diester phosphodiesterase
MPPLNIPTPTIVHHMAALDDRAAPPNSLEAIRTNLQSGADFIEVDINALIQDDYLLVHESVLEAETSGQGPVAGCTPEKARTLWIKRDGASTSCRVPLLSEVVSLFRSHPGPTRLQLDFKNLIPFPSDEPLLRLARLIEPLGDRVLVSTGADWQLRKLRKMAPWLMLGFDIMLYIGWKPSNAHRSPDEFPRQLGAYGYYDDHILASRACWPTAEYLRDRCESLASQVPDISVFYLEHHLIAQSLRDGFNWAEALHARNIKLDAWTMDVTNPAAVQNAPHLLRAGVDLFTSNTPTALETLLRLEKPDTSDSRRG